MSSRTLWEEGRRPGRQIVTLSTLAVAVALAADLAYGPGIGLVLDLPFVAVCVAAALSVRPRDFFTVGVLPPLLMAGAVLTVALLARDAIADADDGLVQAMVSGLAHHAAALFAGYGLALGVLALRQVALRNSGTIRAPHRRSGRTGDPTLKRV